VKFELGLFDNPYKYCDETRKETVGSAKFQEEVLDMAKINCLIKNENELLPLKKSGLKIALIGHWQMILAHWVVENCS
jgi:beta-glucosidase